MPTKAQLLKKYGSEEAVSQHYRDMQVKSRENYKGTGGFKGMNPDKVKEISKLGVEARANAKKAE